MTRIVLTPEQTAILDAAVEPVRICYPDGSIAGWISSTMNLPPRNPGFTAAQIAEAEQGLESDGRWQTTEEVLETLRKTEGA
jgi:hypothetical protein